MEPNVLSAVERFIENQGFSVFVAIYLLFYYDKKMNKILLILDKLSVTLDVYLRKSGGKNES